MGDDIQNAIIFMELLKSRKLKKPKRLAKLPKTDSYKFMRFCIHANFCRGNKQC